MGMENRYDKYKDSGIAWIGEIPEHWEVKRLKFSCNIFGRIGFRGYKSDDLFSEGNGAITLSPSNMKDMKIDYTNRTYLSWEKYYESPEIIISNNDILMVKTGSTYGKCSFVDNIPMECTINPQIVVFKQHKDYPKFLAYSFQTEATRAFIETSVVGGTIPTISQEKIMNYFFVFPPISEQQSIATYLDQKCSEIDELITLQEEMITKLQSYKQSVITEAVTKGLNKNVPLKDSGIKWIGEIPEHWEVKRLKFSCNVFGRIGFRGYRSDDLVSEGNGAITLSPSNMKDMKMDYTNRTYLSWEKYYESPEIMISNNDILMVKTGSTYGKCSFVDNIPMECTINPQIVVFKQHKDYPKFLAYSFQTKATRAFVETSVVGGTIPTIAQEKIMNYFFAFPPLAEQQSIANYLDQKCSEIDELISIKQQKIEKLKDYKKSLIFECVTGKRKV